MGESEREREKARFRQLPYLCIFFVHFFEYLLSQMSDVHVQMQLWCLRDPHCTMRRFDGLRRC